MVFITAFFSAFAFETDILVEGAGAFGEINAFEGTDAFAGGAGVLAKGTAVLAGGTGGLLDGADVVAGGADVLVEASWAVDFGGGGLVVRGFNVREWGALAGLAISPVLGGPSMLGIGGSLGFSCWANRARGTKSTIAASK